MADEHPFPTSFPVIPFPSSRRTPGPTDPIGRRLRTIVIVAPPWVPAFAGMTEGGASEQKRWLGTAVFRSGTGHEEKEAFAPSATPPRPPRLRANILFLLLPSRGLGTAYSGLTIRKDRASQRREPYSPTTRFADNTLTEATGTSPLNDPRTVAVGETGASMIPTIRSIPSITRPNAA